MSDISNVELSLPESNPAERLRKAQAFGSHQHRPLIIDSRMEEERSSVKPSSSGNEGLPPNVDMDKTIMAVRRAGQGLAYDEPDAESRNGYFQGRPIIGRDTPINGGVYLGGGQREAIVIDDKKSEFLSKIYQDVLTESADSQRDGTFKSTVLARVYEKVRQVLPADEKATETIAAPYQNDQKVSIDLFLKAKTGVCRHQALLTAYLLEKLKADGLVRGVVSVDRNAIRGVGGHAWVRYTNSGGEVFIIDPTQGFIGRLSDAGDSSRWFYKRPEDKQIA